MKEKEREDKERWRTERGHLLWGMRTETERMEESRPREFGEIWRVGKE